MAVPASILTVMFWVRWRRLMRDDCMPRSSELQHCMLRRIKSVLSLLHCCVLQNQISCCAMSHIYLSYLYWQLTRMSLNNRQIGLHIKQIFKNTIDNMTVPFGILTCCYISRYILCAIIGDNNINVLDVYSCCFDISNSFYHLVLILGTVTHFVVQRIRMGFYRLMRFIKAIK